MRKLTAVLALPVCVSCAQPAPPADPVAERAAVERAITTWFDSAIATADTAAVRGALAEDFAILEDSMWYDRDGFVALIAGLPAAIGGPFTLKYELSDWRTTVDESVAWTSMTNHAVLTPAKGAPLRLAWRETAVLRRSDARWKIVRYHSAPIR
jgi:ketosteroid isomerase-like protein